MKSIGEVWFEQDGKHHEMIPGRVSIIITAYNKERHVKQCIEAALALEWPDLEIVIVNDGSTDGTLDIINTYKRYTCIKIIDQPNQKSPVALNNGIKASSGEFYVRSDADDWLEPDYIVKTMPRMLADTNKELAAVCTSAMLEGDVHYATRCESFGDSRYAAGLEQEKRQNWLPNGLIRVEAFLQTVGWDPRAEVFADWSMWIDLLKRGWRCAVVDEPLTHYRIQKGESSTTESASVFNNKNEHERLFDQMRQLHPEVWPPDSPAPCLYCKEDQPTLQTARDHNCAPRRDGYINPWPR